MIEFTAKFTGSDGEHEHEFSALGVREAVMLFPANPDIAAWLDKQSSVTVEINPKEA
jgi:hypothetical protein